MVFDFKTDISVYGPFFFFYHVKVAIALNILCVFGDSLG